MEGETASEVPGAARQRFVIQGAVDSQTFPRWINRYARRLGLRGEVSAVRPGEVEVLASGPPDLLDALELGCSLGPIDVWVESIRRESWPA
jgi:acylphosphatase